VDAAKALALGADAVYLGTAVLVALNCNRPLYVEDYQALGTVPYHCHHCHTGRCPVGITTQEPALMQRLDIEAGAERVANLLHTMTLEIQMLARACGKAKVHDLEPEDLRADAGSIDDLRHSAGRDQQSLWRRPWLAGGAFRRGIYGERERRQP